MVGDERKPARARRWGGFRRRLLPSGIASTPFALHRVEPGELCWFVPCFAARNFDVRDRIEVFDVAAA